MPRGSLTDEYSTNADVPPFDKLKLDDHEIARIAIPDLNLIWVEWVHTMRAPVLDEAGEPIPTVTAGRGGKTRPGWATDFVGAFKCFGRDEELRKNRIDPDRCPGCAASARGVRDLEPERRFAIPVIRYDTVNKGTKQLRNPPGAKILVWTLTQKMYDKLMGQKAEIRELLDLSEGTEVRLNQADIVLECEDGTFQRVVFKTPARPAVAHPAVKAVVLPLWADLANRPTDDQLAHAVVKPKERRWAEADVEDHEARWAATDRMRGVGAPPAAGTAGGPVSGDGALDTGLDELLAEPGGPAAAPPPEAPEEDPFAGAAVPDQAPAAGPGGLGEFAPAGQAPAATSSPAAAAPQEDPFAEAGAPAPAPAAAAEDPFAGASAAPAAPAAAPAAPAAAPAASAPPAATSNGSTKGPASFEDVFAAAGE